MLNLGKIFGPSPFAALRAHMDKVTDCIQMMPNLFQALKDNDQAQFNYLLKRISKVEHRADLIKNDIRNHLPKSLFLPIDRSHLLEILATQDHIADKCEDVAVLLSLKPLTFPDFFDPIFTDYLLKNMEAFYAVRDIIHELTHLLESTFSGFEAEKVREQISKVALQEHEADVLQQKLLSLFFTKEEEFSHGTFTLWLKIFESISALSNNSEKLANRIRMTLDIK